MGYYVDIAGDSSASSSGGKLDEFRGSLPEKWRNCTSLREERLRVTATHGAGLSLEKCDFGFSVAGVEAQPGQQLAKGDVIVGIESRVLAGLSAPQMQASFQKRRIDGALMRVAALHELEYLDKLDPAIVECWAAQHQRCYYFHKKTGRTAWTREELEAGAAAAAEAAPSAPVDLASFLNHGFAKPKEAPQKKKQKRPTEDEAAVHAKDESDLARDERQRWNDWNAGGRGGYTEQFLQRYRNCQSNPSKPKPDKRMKGSVGPGQGMEYMARWTGSKNSFN